MVSGIIAINRLREEWLQIIQSICGIFEVTVVVQPRIPTHIRSQFDAMSDSSTHKLFHRWLSDRDLSEYFEVFVDNRIDLEIISALNEIDLRDLGIPLGDRKRLMNEIGKLKVSSEPESSHVLSKSLTYANGLRSSRSERRQLTVLFVDLVESTALVEHRDPEDIEDIMRRFHVCCEDVIERRFGGHIAGYRGDGLTAHFGYPEAREIDAESAISAALEIISAVPKLALDEVTLQIRIGIATGLVVVGDIIGHGNVMEEPAHGSTSNLAARFQALASPNTVTISGSTKKLVGGLFDYEDLGEQEVKGFARPVRAWRVMGRSALASRFEATHPTAGLTPLVGRDVELDTLKQLWNEATTGEGQVVLISGESGIGKSRLVGSFQAELGDESPTTIRFFGSPYHSDSALYPVVEQLLLVAEIDHQDQPDLKIEKLRSLIPADEQLIEEVLPSLAGLLSIPIHRYFQTPAVTATRQKEITFEALETYLSHLSGESPVVIVFEDLHWVDHTTLELLERLVNHVRNRPVLILATYRETEFEAPHWSIEPHVRKLELKRLSPRKSGQMLQGLTGGRSLPDEIASHIVQTCDGIPIFIEELVKVFLESDVIENEGDRYVLSKSLPRISVPSTLQDSLMSRLDRLGPSKDVAQVGAVIGREFSRELLAAAVPISSARLDLALENLAKAGLVHARGEYPATVYAFKHVLVQQAAYSSLLHAKRRELHARIAMILEQGYPELSKLEPELLARHFSGAGVHEKAIEYWQQAGQRAIERSANAEAVGHLTRGLELLNSLPESDQPRERELDLQLALGTTLLMTEGHISTRVEHAYSRARGLCQQIGDSPELFTAMVGLWRFYLSQARFQQALDLGRQGVEIAERMQDDAMRREAQLMVGSSIFYLGQPAQALAHLQESRLGYESTRSPSDAFLRATDPVVMCLSWESWILWKLGYPNQALSRSEEAIDLADRIGHPYGRGFALFFSAVLHHRRREAIRAENRARAAIELSEERGFTRWLAGGQIILGWALAEQGKHAEGLELVRTGLNAWRKQAKQGLPHLQAILAEVHMKIGEYEEALRLLENCMSLVAQTDEHRYEAELCRLIGETLLALSKERPEFKNRESEVEQYFLKAVQIAQEQEAKCFELRAAVSLASYWELKGNGRKTRKLLEDITSWFTAVSEGLDTEDFQEATRLLSSVR